LKNSFNSQHYDTPSYSVTFFAVDKNGQQIKLKKLGSGRLGDYKYKKIDYSNIKKLRSASTKGCQTGST